MKNRPKNYFLLHVKRKIGTNAYFLKYFDPLQAIEIKVRPVEIVASKQFSSQTTLEKY